MFIETSDLSQTDDFTSFSLAFVWRFCKVSLYTDGQEAGTRFDVRGSIFAVVAPIGTCLEKITRSLLLAESHK